MSGSTPTVKDLYKVITADLSAYLSTEKPQEQEPPRETIQHYLDRFVRSNTTGQQNQTPTPTTPSSAGGHHSSSATPVLGNLSSGVSPNVAVSTPTTPVAGGAISSTAAGQRHASELWYQSLTNSTALQHSNNLPFAFHRLRQASANAASPIISMPTSQNASTTGSPIIGGGTTAASGQPIISGQATSILGINANLPSSPSVHPSLASFVTSNPSANSSLVAQKFSAHLITLYTQDGIDAAPISSVAARMIVYLMHLMPFLTPRLIITDWWDRLIEPSLQGEIKLEKEALKACRDLVTECMIRDSIFDSQRPGNGSLLVAGDEEGQLDMSIAKTVMPVPQFVLRKYIMAAHRLNHRLGDADGSWLKANIFSTQGHAGHTSGTSGLSFTTPPSNLHSTAQSRSEYPTGYQDMEKQHRLLSNARAVIRRKNDILFKNLESILFSYGGGVGRVKDFFSCLYTYFVGARFRAEILGLLCQFIRRQRVHLHQILVTPLFDSLLLSLKYDTSPLIVSLGLMTLIMLMPRIPTALNDRLPDLFLILSRILCWPRSRQQLMAVTNQDGNRLTGQTIKSFDEFDDEHPNAGSAVMDDIRVVHDDDSTRSSSPEDIEFDDIPLYNHGIRWRRYGPDIPGGTTEGAPDPTAIFSFLYGLFPCNLLKFLHSPRVYMQQALTPSGSPKQGSGPHLDEEDSVIKSPDVISSKDTSDKALYIDEDLLKSRVRSLLKRHSLHPDLLTLTSEQEIADKARWQKLEPMEIVAMCVGLDVWSAGGLYGMGPVLKSIEDDYQGVPQDDTDDETDDTETLATLPHSPRKMSETSLELSAQSQSQSTQAQVRASIESSDSPESERIPIEILAQEEFFGPRTAAKEIQSQSLHPASALSNPRTHAGAVGGIPPKTRPKSREVKMSQILRNFATLRGLDYDEFIAETHSGRSLGPSITLKDRRPSIRKDNENSIPTSSSTATHAAGIVYGDIPSEDSVALATQAEANHDSSLHSTAMAGLVLQNQDFRKTILQLERDLLMAKNELNFELFLKQQHIQQISKVHRAHVLDASVEAERQNLYNTCRSLKAQLQETRLLLEKEKNELEKRKKNQSHWDTELKNKMQMFRDERKQLQFEVERLKQDIKDTRQSQEIQERLLIDERKGAFHLKNTIEDLSPKLKRMEEYEKQIEEMTRQLVLWESEQTKALEMQRQIEIAVSHWQNLQLLLAAEKEEARILRNKVSQQSQILDDMRIQLAMNEGHRVGDMLETPSMEYLPEEREFRNRGLVRTEESELENFHSTNVHGAGGDSDADIGRGSGHESGVVSGNEQSTGQRSSNSMLHRSHAIEMNWPTGFSRSNSSQQGFGHQRKAMAMQEFMVREKERWDRDLQEAHSRWSREAVRNQELEDRILELQGQLEMARAIDVRQKSTFSGGQVGHGNGNQAGGGDGAIGADDGSGMHLIDFSSQPQNVPYSNPAGSTSRMKIHDQFGDEGDMDDGGFGSSGMIGRYSNRDHGDVDDDDDEGMIANASIRRSRSVGYPAQDVVTATNHALGKLNTSQQIELQSSNIKGKGEKSKSKSRWLVPAVLERAQTDVGPFGATGGPGAGVLQSHLTGATPHVLDLVRQSSSSSTASSQKNKSVDTNMATRSGSSAAAARATAGGLFPPLFYSRSNTSHLSDGANSDVTSDTSSVAGGGSNSGRNPEDDAESSGAGGPESPTASGPSAKSGKKNTRVKTERELEREKERIQLISGTGPLVDPSKMYRNVRMY